MAVEYEFCLCWKIAVFLLTCVRFNNGYSECPKVSFPCRSFSFSFFFFLLSFFLLSSFLFHLLGLEGPGTLCSVKVRS